MDKIDWRNVVIGLFSLHAIRYYATRYKIIFRFSWYARHNNNTARPFSIRARPSGDAFSPSHGQYNVLYIVIIHIVRRCKKVVGFFLYRARTVAVDDNKPQQWYYIITIIISILLLLLLFLKNTRIRAKRVLHARQIIIIIYIPTATIRYKEYNDDKSSHRMVGDGGGGGSREGREVS